MNKHFLSQLTDAVSMTNNKQYVKQLKRINKQHNFIVLRTLYGDDYETEMHRAMLLGNLQHIHENLCFKSKIKLPNPYREMQPIDFTNKNINHAKTVEASFFKRRFG